VKRDIRLSVSKKNKELFDICKVLKDKGYSPSSFICIAAIEKYHRDVKIVMKKDVLSPVQQDVTTPTYIRPSKTEAEIKIENERLEAERLKEIERKRLRQVELANIKALMKRQD